MRGVQVLESEVLTLRLALRRDGGTDGKGVEERTLDYLLGEEQEAGWKGLHCENGEPQHTTG